LSFDKNNFCGHEPGKSSSDAKGNATPVHPPGYKETGMPNRTDANRHVTWLIQLDQRRSAKNGSF
jgi:hypothetical protein